MIKREEQRRERKIMRQLEKQQRKLSAKGVEVDLKTLRKEWEQKRLNGGASVSNEDGNSRSEADDDLDEIDVVGDDMIPPTSTADSPGPTIKRQATSFSIDSLLSKAEASHQTANDSN